MQFLQPDPVLLFYLAVKQTAWLPLVFALGLVRGIGGRGAGRWLALLTVALAAAFIAAQVAAATPGLWNNPAVMLAGRLRGIGGGLAVLLAVSLPLLLSGFVRPRRYRWIDVVHGLALLGLLGLAAYERFG